MNDKYITITQLTKYIKYKIDQDEHLMNVYLKGEISNFKAHTRGHYYFTLKDESSRINAVMFASSASKLPFVPIEGMKVLVTGKISVYEATGGYQIYVNEMLEDGVGNLYIALEQLKGKLESEGLFLEKHKKPIPKIPRRVGIITASTGAAVKDILTTIKRRYPLVETVLFPSLVQGEFAKDDIVRQIRRANECELDVLIVGRGGGSIEDLWAFNEEVVARAIFDSNIPVISAVGHEVDFTISDFVADLRAPTPTAAAELAVPSGEELLEIIKGLGNRSYIKIRSITDNYQKHLKRLEESYVLTNPSSIYVNKEQTFDRLYERFNLSVKNYLKNYKDKVDNLVNSYVLVNPINIYQSKKVDFENIYNRLKISIDKNIIYNSNKYDLLINKLEVLNPLNTLKRGYAVARVNNKAVTCSRSVSKGDLLEVEFSDGRVITEVKEKVNGN